MSRKLPIFEASIKEIKSLCARLPNEIFIAIMAVVVVVVIAAVAVVLRKRRKGKRKLSGSL